MTGGGIDFKTGSRWNFENIFLEPEREFNAEPEPKKGLGILGAELALRLGRQRRLPVWIRGPKPVSRSMRLRCPFSEARRLQGPGQFGSGGDWVSQGQDHASHCSGLRAGTQTGKPQSGAWLTPSEPSLEMPSWKEDPALKRPAVALVGGAAGTTSESVARPLEAPFPPQPERPVLTPACERERQGGQRPLSNLQSSGKPRRLGPSPGPHSSWRREAGM